MKRSHTAAKTLLALTGIALPAALTYLVAPGRSTAAQKEPFAGRTYAHRGLYAKDQSVPENSLPAFRRAVEAGYGIELDLQITKDDKVVVFHDDDLSRACGTALRALLESSETIPEGRAIKDWTYKELQKLTLFESGEKIPLFSDVLKIVSGRSPMIVEFKSVGRDLNAHLCARACRLLDNYDGPFMVESFDPRIVRWFRKNRPDILRGQLACRPSGYKKGTPFPVPYLFAYCLANFAGRPQFIAYGLPKRPLLVRYAELLGAMKVCWTSHDLSAHKGQDVVIFEHYKPPVRL